MQLQTSKDMHTFRTMPAPNHTSPTTLRLSSSMMLGIDLNRLKKLATYKERKDHRHYQEASTLNRHKITMLNIHLLKLRAQFNRRICRIFSCCVPDNKAIFYSIEVRLQRRSKGRFRKAPYDI